MTSLFPPCGGDCAKQKQLDDLKAAMDNSTPENAQKAKTDYYTALYGQEWLQGEKERIAKEQVEPVLRKYRSDYDQLVLQGNAQNQFSDLAMAIKSDGGTPLLLQDYRAEKSKADAMNRMAVLTDPWVVSGTGQSWYGYFLYAMILLILFAIVFVLYRKYSATTPALSTPLSGGNSRRK
jgi:hypothetical protein